MNFKKFRQCAPNYRKPHTPNILEKRLKDYIPVLKTLYYITRSDMSNEIQNLDFLPLFTLNID